VAATEGANMTPEDIALFVPQALGLTDAEMQDAHISFSEDSGDIDIKVEFPNELKMEERHREALKKLLRINSN
jgi:hypothetical protein